MFALKQTKMTKQLFFLQHRQYIWFEMRETFPIFDDGVWCKKKSVSNHTKPLEHDWLTCLLLTINVSLRLNWKNDLSPYYQRLLNVSNWKTERLLTSQIGKLNNWKTEHPYVSNWKTEKIGKLNIWKTEQLENWNWKTEIGKLNKWWLK